MIYMLLTKMPDFVTFWKNYYPPNLNFSNIEFIYNFLHLNGEIAVLSFSL